MSTQQAKPSNPRVPGTPKAVDKTFSQRLFSEPTAKESWSKIVVQAVRGGDGKYTVTTLYTTYSADNKKSTKRYGTEHGLAKEAAEKRIDEIATDLIKKGWHKARVSRVGGSPRADAGSLSDVPGPTAYKKPAAPAAPAKK